MNKFFGSAVALLAASSVLFSSGVAHATTFTTELVHTFSTTDESSLRNIVSLGDKVIVDYNDEMWISDGTDAGTTQISFPEFFDDFVIESDQSNQYSVVLDDELYFFAYDSVGGADQLYKTDGATINMVTTPFPGFDDFYSLVARDGNMYAWVENVTGGIGYTDLVQITPGGVVTNISGGNDCSTSEHPSQIQLIGTKLIYVNDPTENCDYGLFAYDTVTEEIEELNGPAGDLYASDNYIDDEEDRFFMFEGEMYFGAEASGVGNELFATDGTADGTRLVKDIYPGGSGSYPMTDDGCAFEPQTLGGYFYFGGYNSDNESVLFKSDGTEAGTTQAVSAEVATNPGCSTYSQPPVLDGKMIIPFTAEGTGSELHATDGTDAGTVLLADINEGTSTSLCENYCAAPVLFEDHVFFIANDFADGVVNQEIWVTDGTPAGTVKVSDFAGGFAVGNADATFVEAGGELFFAVGNYTSDGGDGTVALYKIGSREDSDNLAATGTDAAASLWASLGLLVAGAAVVTARRRRL